LQHRERLQPESAHGRSLMVHFNLLKHHVGLTSHSAWGGLIDYSGTCGWRRGMSHGKLTPTVG
jgi:hypothetical protein